MLPMGSKEKQRTMQLGKLLICEVVIYFLEFTAYKSQVTIISLCNIFKRNYHIIDVSSHICSHHFSCLFIAPPVVIMIIFLSSNLRLRR